MIAKFIGQDGSLGFRTGRKYIINIERDNNWIWVKELFGRICPYQSMNTLKNNWDIPSNKFHPARQYRQLFVFRFSKCIWRFFGRGQIIFTKSKNFFPEIYPRDTFAGTSGSCRLLSRAKQIDSPNIIKNCGKSFNEHKVQLSYANTLTHKNKYIKVI